MKMLEAQGKISIPTVRIGRLNHPRDAKRTLRRLAQAVVDGRLESSRGNCAGYLIGACLKAIELEIAERLEVQIKALKSSPPVRPAPFADAMDAELVAQ